MSSIPKSLWPADIAGTSTRTPVSILREQAAALGQLTNNVVEARVSSVPIGNGGLQHSFYIVAPALGGYEYELLTVQHPIDLYPCTVIFERTGTNVKSPEELEEVLRNMFANEKTKKIVSALRSQSLDATA